MKSEFTADEAASLKNDVYCSTLQSKEDYVKTVEQADSSCWPSTVSPLVGLTLLPCVKLLILPTKSRPWRSTVSPHTPVSCFSSARSKNYFRQEPWGCRILAKTVGAQARAHYPLVVSAPYDIFFLSPQMFTTEH